jgi:predicted RNase H-like HicB family nuclease
VALKRTLAAVIEPGDDGGYIAYCSDLKAYTQGATLDEAAANLREVLALALQDEDLSLLGLAPDPVVVLTMELDGVLASA